MQPKQFRKMADVPDSNIIDSKGEVTYSKVMMIGHYIAAIVAHYHASNMAAVFSDCMPGKASNSLT